MAIITKVQWDPNTLKVIRNSATGKVQTMDVCYPDDAECPDGCDCEYGFDFDYCWPEEGTTPKYICVTLSCIKKCSDGSWWDDLNKSFCLEQQVELAYYKNTVVSGGNTYTISYYLGVANKTYFYIYREAEITYWAFSGSATWKCSDIVNNGLFPGDCGGPNEGYGGYARLLNPCA